MAIGQRTILYFGNNWDAENRTSSHHVARCLANEHIVYYFECPGMRGPRGTTRDLKRIVQQLWRFVAGAREVGPRLRIQTLVQIPLHRFALVRRLNAWLLRETVRWLMWRRGIRHPILWFVAPHVASLLGQLGETLSVYYCTDDHAALPGVDADAVRAMDEILTRKADLVFVASATLLAKKSRVNPHTYHSAHGVDLQHFGRAQAAASAAPDDIARLPRPIIGFFGLIERWIDLELVAYLAEQRPQWSFAMIGRVAMPPAATPRLPNMHFLGKRPYEELPDYGRHFAAAIIPYRLTQQVWHANPLKLREYLAMGKPVVSVAMPESEQFADVVALARNRDEFLAQLDAAVAAGNDGAAAQRRINRVRGESWEARVRNVLGHVESMLQIHEAPAKNAAFVLFEEIDPGQSSHECHVGP